VLGARVRRLEVGNSAALGAALRAAHAVDGVGFDALTERFARPDGAVEREPVAGARGVYDELGRRFADELQARFGA
jgi:sugar (pentulose or hexulose) kinase